MRLCRFDNGRLGVAEGDRLRDVTRALDVLPAYRYPLPTSDPLITNLSAVAEQIRALLPSAPAVPLSGPPPGARPPPRLSVSSADSRPADPHPVGGGRADPRPPSIGARRAPLG